MNNERASRPLDGRRRASTIARAGAPGRTSRAALALSVPVLAALLAASPLAAQAGGPIVALGADARSTVANDEMIVILSVDRDGPQVAPLNEAVLTELNAAIAQARRSPSVKAKLAGVYTNPLYGNQGKPTGYRVSGRIELVSNDFPALSALAGDLGQRLSFGGVSFRLTPQRRAQEEQVLTKAAADAFRAKAQGAARAFDFESYEIRKLSGGGELHAPPMPRMRAMAAPAAEAFKAATPVPEDGGESEVVVTISGEVELRR
ncbi:MAG: SIMPL domain-containing protein [Burkholderiaceae bacterium]